jgi:hypothetical protein
MMIFPKNEFVTNATLYKLAEINPTVTWLLDELAIIKPYDKIGKSKIYRTADIIQALESSASPYLQSGAERLRDALKKE